MAVALVFFALGTATVISSKTGGHPRTVYWNKIFSGIGYLLLGVQGIVVSPYLEGLKMAVTIAIAGIFAVFGILLFAWGLNQKKNKTKTS